MNTQNRLNRLEQGTKTKLKKNLDLLKPLLTVKGQFDATDLPDNAKTMQLYKHLGVIEQVGMKVVNKRHLEGYTQNSGTNNLRIWEWKPRCRTYVEKELAKRDELPCGHGVHIYNDPKVDELGCKHCVDNGSHPEYSKDFIRELMG